MGALPLLREAHHMLRTTSVTALSVTPPSGMHHRLKSPMRSLSCAHAGVTHDTEQLHLELPLCSRHMAPQRWSRHRSAS